VRASPLTGRRWLGTGGRQLSLSDFRGRLLLLDFWTFCCVNCLHVLDELRPVEEQFAEELVVVGVHSPKFEHERDPAAVEAAVERYGVRHPVLDDPDLTTWQAYAARAWPTLVLVDPEGYVVAQMSGEGHAHGLTVLLEELVAEHGAKGTLQRGGGPYVPPPPPATSLRFPGKVAALPGGGWLVSDTAHHQLVELDDDLVTERRRIGSGATGLVDGAPDVAAFSEPQGVHVLPAQVATATGVDVVVADSVNHAVRGVRLSDGAVTTLAGTGRQLRTRPDASTAAVARETDLSTPWDLTWWQPDGGEGTLLVAMAGTHQLWSVDLLAHPVTAVPVAGTTEEGLRDGSGPTAWLAQPSGLAAGADGVWVADSETSALRLLRGGGEAPVLETRVGVGLFEFGHVDGPADRARLQHPLGVAVLPDGSVAVADTYNGAVRRFDPSTGTVTTLADGLAEPSDVAVDTSGPEPLLVVVESAAHRLVRVRLPREAAEVRGEARRTTRPPTPVRASGLELRVDFVPPTGQKLDDRWGDPTSLSVSASPPDLLLEGGGRGTGLRRSLVLDPALSAGVLHVSVQAAACDGDPATGEVPEHAACHLYQQDWGIPVEIGPDGSAELVLPLRAG
jgi:thiol-disulfide isomerase/thioredoxin